MLATNNTLTMLPYILYAILTQHIIIPIDQIKNYACSSYICYGLKFICCYFKEKGIVFQILTCCTSLVELFI